MGRDALIEVVQSQFDLEEVSPTLMTDILAEPEPPSAERLNLLLSLLPTTD
jgi:hypothetical protein